MLIIAEIGQAHDGSLGLAHSFIDALANTGIDAVKFQTHIAEAESSLHEPFRTKFSYEDKTRFDYWKRMEFTSAQWLELKQHCEEQNLEFMSSPFSVAAVELLEQVGVKRYKIGSGEVNNMLLLEKIARSNKPVIISSGMSSFHELDSAYDLLKNKGCDVSILQCTTSYPTKPSNWGLNVISDLKKRYNTKIGFSDHSGDIYACLAAAALGAEILEFHVTFDKKMFGPDAYSSLNIHEVKKLVEGVRSIEISLQNPIDKRNNIDFTDLKKIFEKSLAVNRPLKKGDIIIEDYLETKKPKGMGIPADKYQKVLSMKLSKDLEQWDFLNFDDLEMDSQA